MTCVTVHNIQNNYRHGSYNYDQRLERMANRDDEHFKDDHAEDNPIPVNVGPQITALQRQRDIIIQLNNN